MPAYVTARIQRLLNERGQAVRGAKALVLGVTYKPDVRDERESPARPLARRLLDLGADLRFHDPFVEEWDVNGQMLTRVASLHEEITAADIVVLLQPHAQYDLDEIAARASCLFDTSGRLSGDNVERL